MNDQIIDNLFMEIVLGNPYELKTNFKRDEDELSYRRGISYLMNDLGLIKQPFTNSPILDLTPFGVEVLKKGGWLEHVKSQQKVEEESEKNRKARELAELENLTSTTKVNKWLLKTKYLPHILSFISVIVSIVFGLVTINSDRENKLLDGRINKLEEQINTERNARIQNSKITEKNTQKTIDSSAKSNTKPAANSGLKQ